MRRWLPASPDPDTIEASTMANSDPDQPTHDFERISPASVELSGPERATAYTGSPERVGGRRGRWLIWAGVAVLVASVVVVTFILPGRVAPRSSASPISAVKSPAVPVQDGGAVSQSPAAPPGGPAPWSDAQMEQMRRDSQDILEKLLNLQHQLKDMSVESWAAKDYTDALKLAKDGDKAYADQKYDQAKSHYGQALAAMQTLVQRAGQEYQQSVDRGNQALVDGNSTVATDAFQRALLIRPGDTAAAHGLKRAGSLDQVLDLIAAGDKQRSSGHLEDARDSYRQAQKLDPESSTAQQRLREIGTRIQDRDFAAAMSAGLSALDAGQLESARKQFENALRLKPDAAPARDALAQTRERITSGRIDELLKQANAQSQSEDWNAAVNTYRAALALDPTLSEAQQGKTTAEERADLDLRLSRTIARPDRLTDRPVRDSAAALLLEAMAVKEPGTHLKKQITELGGLLKASVQPVEVTLQSDKATNVNIYHVGVLGSFEVRRLALKPGHYVAVGSRAGYRDVRVEFDVSADVSPAPVVIECHDKINLNQ